MSAPHVAIVGNVNVDMIMGPLAPWPRAGTEVVLPDYELRVGGQAGNAALALAALGVPFRLLANAGDDALGRWLKESFGSASEHWRLADVPTTVSVGVTHPNGERTFLTSAGHLEWFGPADVLPHLPERAAAGSIALMVGAFLSPPFADGLSEIVAAVRMAGYRVALDTGWPPEGWTAEVRRRFAEWLPATEILLLNEAEAFALSGEDAIEAAASAVRALLSADATLVVKRGAEGASAWRGQERADVTAPAVEVADSIGAGDVFNAGFLAAELGGRPLEAAVRAGVGFASAVIATRPRRYDPALVGAP